MNHPVLSQDDSQLAYIRLVPREALPEEVRARTEGMDQIYSIHGPNGQILALVDDREKAFVMARLNEMHPVSVH